MNHHEMTREDYDFADVFLNCLDDAKVQGTRKRGDGMTIIDHFAEVTMVTCQVPDEARGLIQGHTYRTRRHIGVIYDVEVDGAIRCFHDGRFTRDRGWFEYYGYERVREMELAQERLEAQHAMLRGEP